MQHPAPSFTYIILHALADSPYLFLYFGLHTLTGRHICSYILAFKH